MKNKKISLEFLDSKDSIELNNEISFIDNPNLLDFLRKEKYKKNLSSLIYKESTETNASDLLKIKINVKSVGYFLVNFVNTEENNHYCLEIIDKVKALKSDDDFNLEAQYLKIRNIIDILNGYNLLFVSFSLETSIPDNYINFKEYTFNFPLLFINDVPIKKTEKIKKIKEKKIFFNINAHFFDLDYLFNLLFALFASFSLHTAVSLFSNNNWKGILFIILFIAILSVLNYCLFLIYYDKKAKQISGHKLIMGLYLALGSALGLIVSILISQYYLEIRYIGVLAFIDVFSFAICVCSIFESKIIKLFKK